MELASRSVLGGEKDSELHQPKLSHISHVTDFGRIQYGSGGSSRLSKSIHHKSLIGPIMPSVLMDIIVQCSVCVILMTLLHAWLYARQEVAVWPVVGSIGITGARAKGFLLDTVSSACNETKDPERKLTAAAAG